MAQEHDTESPALIVEAVGELIFRRYMEGTSKASAIERVLLELPSDLRMAVSATGALEAAIARAGRKQTALDQAINSGRAQEREERESEERGRRQAEVERMRVDDAARGITRNAPDGTLSLHGRSARG